MPPILPGQRHARQPVVIDVEHRVVQQEQIGLRPRQVFAERQCRHQRPDHEDANQETAQQPGKDPRCPLGQEDEGRLRRVEALADQITADREEHEDAGEAENRLAAGQDHQRVVILRVLGQEKGMRENDGERRHQPQ